jgi:hypothetical protein
VGRYVCQRARRITSVAIIAAIVVACSKGSTPDDPQDGGPVASNTSVPTSADCANAQQIHPNPECDSCMRTLCCPNALDCDKSADCTQLRGCLAACPPGGRDCAETCRLKHDEGTRLLGIITECSQARCSAPCSGVTVSTDGG